MIITCLLTFIVSASDGNWYTNAEIEGKLLSETADRYVVDFTKKLKKYPDVVNPEGYNNIAIDKNRCTK